MGDRSQKRLLLSLLVTIIILIAEVIGGIMSHSLALLSDAGHMLTDAFALGLSLVALLIMKQPSDHRATYGYQRIGLIAALINGVSLVVIALFIFTEAYKRYYSPPEINTSTIASGIVGVMIIIGGTRVIQETLWILLDLSPVGFHAEDISTKIAGIPEVRSIHDVHIWSIGHGIPAFSGHVQVPDQKISETDVVRKKIERLLVDQGIKHAVIQMERADCCNNDLYCNVNTENSLADHQH